MYGDDDGLVLDVLLAGDNLGQSYVGRERWSSVRLQGPESMKHAAWIALTSAGFPVLGFTPSGTTTQGLELAGKDATAPNDVAYDPLRELDGFQPGPLSPWG